MTKQRSKYVDMVCSKCGKEYNARPHSIYGELDMCRKCIVKEVKR
jgi:ribosomal protein S14